MNGLFARSIGKAGDRLQAKAAVLRAGLSICLDFGRLPENRADRIALFPDGVGDYTRTRHS
jgi:hypothetical protein